VHLLGLALLRLHNVRDIERTPQLSSASLNGRGQKAMICAVMAAFPPPRRTAPTRQTQLSGRESQQLSGAGTDLHQQCSDRTDAVVMDAAPTIPATIHWR
jgi:hypothetical protein